MAKTKKFNTTIKLHDLTFEYSPIANKPSTMTVSSDGNSIKWTDSDSVKKTLMLLEDFATNGKIRADKIEALGLTEIILTNEVGISAFVSNYASYEFQKNDVIAVLNSQGTYDLYIYIGYDKSSAANYLATGLSNITIGMVQGLQAALDSKLDKPSSTGSYYLTKIVSNGTAYYQYNIIDLQPGDIPVSRGTFIGASVIYESLGNKIGVNTKLPQEALDVNGNIKSNSYKFTLQPSITPQPNMLIAKTDGSGLIWYDNNSVGSEVGANKVSVLNAINSMSDAEKDTWRLAQRKSTETYSVGQPRVDTILPPVIDNSNNFIQYVTLVGLNLFLNNSSPSTAMVKLKRYKDINSNSVSETIIDITNYQVYQQNASILSFGINYNSLETGYYKVEVTHNGIVNIGTSDLLVTNNVNNNTIILNSWETYTPFEPSNLVITPTSIKKTYGSVIRGSTVIEQQVKHFIINASDVLSGFRIKFNYKLSPAGTELSNVKHRQSISFGLGYNKDVNNTIVPEILISFIRGVLNIGNATQPPLSVPYIYDIDIVVKNGLATVVINLTNTGTIYTATFSFEQKNEQMFFYSTFLGSNPDSSVQIAGTTQELLFPTTYQSF